MGARRTLVLLAGASGIALGVGAWMTLSRLDPAASARHVEALGPLGPLGIVALLVVQCVVAPIPSEPIMMAAGYLYGPRGGFALAWCGIVVGAAACFGLARRHGRPFVERFVRPDRLTAVDTWVRDRGAATAFLAILAVRVAAFGAFDVLSYACGLLPVRFAWFVVATAIGAVPKALAFTYVGAYAATRPAWVDVLVLAGTFGILAAVPWLARRLSRPSPS
jgi:uncharacterized membrane protein YdjX (TVP38/TMEM64 family)